MEKGGNTYFPYYQKLHCHGRVLRGSVVKCLTRNIVVLGSSRTESTGFFVEVSAGKALQSPSLLLVKPRKDMNNVGCRTDITEMVLKAA